MPAEHFVPRFAAALNISPRVQANALRALALADEPTPVGVWPERAAAALILGAQWEGEEYVRADVANATHVAENAIAEQYDAMAKRLRGVESR